MLAPRRLRSTQTSRWRTDAGELEARRGDDWPWTPRRSCRPHHPALRTSRAPSRVSCKSERQKSEIGAPIREKGIFAFFKGIFSQKKGYSSLGYSSLKGECQTGFLTGSTSGSVNMSIVSECVSTSLIPVINELKPDQSDGQPIRIDFFQIV